MTGIVTSELRALRPLTGHELVPPLKANCKGAIKMTLPSATQVPAISYKRGITDKVYADHSALLWDIVEIMKKELARLAAEGVAYIQIDAPSLQLLHGSEMARLDFAPKMKSDPGYSSR